MSDAPTQADPAAVFAAAVSLWQAVNEPANQPGLNLSECYHGIDELMRVVMRIATEFERWSCAHVNFDELNDVWPYRREDAFGAACLSVLGGPEALMDFDTKSCLRVAWKLRLPAKADSGLPVAVDVTAANPQPDAAFRAFRIRTVRLEGLAGKDDPAVWQAAQESGRFLITQDLDFSDVRRFAPGTHRGLLLVGLHQPGRLALTARLGELWRNEECEMWARCFVVLPDHKLRVLRPDA